MKQLLCTITLIILFFTLGCQESSPTTSTGDKDSLGETTPLQKPTITEHPSNIEVLIGKSATFKTKATGGALTYQWKRDGEKIKSATKSQYTLSAVSQNDNGALFSVVVFNDSGTVSSESGKLTVVTEITPPKITKKLTPISVKEGESVTFSCSAEGINLTYVWKKDGIVVNESSNSYTLSTLSFADNGTTITCIVSNEKGSVTTETTLTVTKEGKEPIQIKRMKLIEAKDATFQMGIKDSFDIWDGAAMPIHKVHLTHNFYMDSTEVTVEQFIAVMNWAYKNGYISVVKKHESGDGAYTKTGEIKRLLTLSDNKRVVLWRDDESIFVASTAMEKRPVTHISWYGAAFYCNMLSLQDGLSPAYNLSTWECDYSVKGYRLPTESEWEFACRGGKSTPWYWGDRAKFARNYAHFGQGGTYTVASYKPNKYGLYDMAGNAKEWCNDWHAPYSATEKTNPIGLKSGDEKVQRSFQADVNYLRSGVRGSSLPEVMSIYTGFRIVIEQ